jgi:hypothetical protein
MRENDEEKSGVVPGVTPKASFVRLADVSGVLSGILMGLLIISFKGNLPTVKIWQPLAHIHLHSAHILSEKTVEVESRHDSSQQPSEALTDEYMAYATGTIFVSVAFLKALGYKKRDPQNGTLKKLHPKVITAMANAWEIGTDWGNEPSLRQFLRDPRKNLPERWFILDKYQLALYLADDPPYSKLFDKKGKLWEDVTLLVDLRNYLTHHKPEWIAFPPEEEPYKAEKDETTRLLRELRNRGFTNALYPGEGSIFTLLGSKSSCWAVSTSVTFVKEFRDKMPLDLSSLTGL